MRNRARHLRPLLTAWLCLAGLLACRAPQAPADNRDSSAHNLSLDEEHGGHTLQRHIGRTDNDLRERLQHEPNISAASTYTDRATAERVIGVALQQNAGKIQRWIERGPRRPNLVLDYADPNDAVGRVMNRNAMGSVPCERAIVVLKSDGDGYYVLTSYPECRP